MQLWRVTPSTKQIQIMSIPRDTVVSMLPPDTSQFGTYNRINSSYNTGADQLVKTITANFGIPINHVVQVDFSGFQDAVNALGGIYLNFPYPAKDSYSGLDITTPGCQLLNGAQALAVARARHYEYYANGYWQYDGTSDFGRIQRQDVFLRSLITSAKSKVNPLTVNAFIGSIHEGVTIDDGFGINELIGLALDYHSFDPANLQAQTLPTEAANGFGDLGDVLTVQQPEAQQMLVNIFGSTCSHPTNPPPDANGDPNPPPPVTPTTVAPASPTTSSGAVRVERPRPTAPAAFLQPHALHAAAEPGVTLHAVAGSPADPRQRRAPDARRLPPPPRRGPGPGVPAQGRALDAAPGTSPRPGARPARPACRGRSPRARPRPVAAPSPSLSGPRSASWIDIIPLKVEISRRTSSTRLALDGGRHQRGRGLADGAARAADLQVGQLAVLDDHRHHDLVAAQRVEALHAVGRRRVQLATVPGRAVVVEDDLAVELFEVGHQPNNLPASSNPSISTSMSCSSLNRDNEARAVAWTPRRRISGLAQWWPGRTHTPNWSSTCARSCACTSR